MENTQTGMENTREFTIGTVNTGGGAFININNSTITGGNFAANNAPEREPDEREKRPTGDETADLPPELTTDDARAMTRRLIEAGMMDEALCPVGLSHAERGVLAARLSERLAIRNTWQTFSRLWRMKPETLRIAFSRALDQRKTLLFQERLNRIIN